MVTPRRADRLALVLALALTPIVRSVDVLTIGPATPSRVVVRPRPQREPAAVAVVRPPSAAQPPTPVAWRRTSVQLGDDAPACRLGRWD